VNQDSALPGGVAADVDTEITNSKQLYQTFMKLVEGNTINFITQGQANRQQHQINNAYNKNGAGSDDDAFN